MKLNCYITSDRNLEIKPASRHREWMEKPVVNNVRRCLPVLMASSNGWEILNPSSFTAIWNGGPEKKDTIINLDTPEDKSIEQPESIISSHFGGGIITFEIGAIFETSPKINLWITGSPNYFKDAAQPLSAMIESDWMPYTFSMNWKITRKNYPIRFEEGEPICFFFPLQRGLTELCDPKICSLDDNKPLAKKFNAAYKKRLVGTAFRNKSKIDNSFIEHAKALHFQKWYTKGELPDGSGKPDEHQTKLHVRSFIKADESD